MARERAARMAQAEAAIGRNVAHNSLRVFELFRPRNGPIYRRRSQELPDPKSGKPPQKQKQKQKDI
jgi:hypothetical protein